MEASLKYTDENLHALQKTCKKTQKRAVCANCARTCLSGEKRVQEKRRQKVL